MVNNNLTPKTSSKLAIILSILFFIIACDNFLDSDDKHSDPEIYYSDPEGNYFFVGYYISNDNRIPCYWSNGQRTDLEWNGKNVNGEWDANAEARDYIFSGDDIYILGLYGVLKTVIWKNGEVIDIHSMLNEIVAAPRTIITNAEVVDGRLIATGMYGDGYYSTFMYIEGTGITIDNNAGYGEIFVSGSDVYVFGHYDDRICIWKNGTKACSDRTGTDVIITSFTELNGEITAIGVVRDSSYKPTLAKWVYNESGLIFDDSLHRGLETALGESAYAGIVDMAVSNGKLYLTGNYSSNGSTGEWFFIDGTYRYEQNVLFFAGDKRIIKAWDDDIYFMYTRDSVTKIWKENDFSNSISFNGGGAYQVQGVFFYNDILYIYGTNGIDWDMYQVVWTVDAAGNHRLADQAGLAKSSARYIGLNGELYFAYPVYTNELRYHVWMDGDLGPLTPCNNFIWVNK